MTRLIPKRPSITSVKYQDARRKLGREMAKFLLLSDFQKRVALRKAGLPTALYKYRAIPPSSDAAGRGRLENLLLRNQLWMAPIASFNDPFEGSAIYELPPMSATELRRKLAAKNRAMGYAPDAAARKVNSDDIAHRERLTDRANAGRQRVLNEMGMCALSAVPNNPLMWAHYTRDHTGLCVQLRLATDLKALLPHQIEYNDQYPVLTDFLEATATREELVLLRKTVDWSYEREWRVVDQERTCYLRDFAPEALSAIILGMRISDEDRAYVSDLMEQRKRRFGTVPKVYVASKHPRKYRIVLSRLR